MDRPFLNPAVGPASARFSDPRTTPSEQDVYATAFLSRAQKGTTHNRIIPAMVGGWLMANQDVGELTEAALLARRLL